MNFDKIGNMLLIEESLKKGVQLFPRGISLACFQHKGKHEVVRIELIKYVTYGRTINMCLCIQQPRKPFTSKRSFVWRRGFVH